MAVNRDPVVYHYTDDRPTWTQERPWWRSPAHLLAGLFWLNFLALVWVELFQVILGGVGFWVMVVFAIIPVMLSLIAMTPGKEEKR